MSWIQHCLQLVLLSGSLRCFYITDKTEATTEEVLPLFTTFPEEEMARLPEETLEIYDDKYPSLFGRVTPNRIQETLHELTTLKGIDDVGEVSQFSLFHGNDKNSRLDHNKVANSFMRRVKTSYLQNLRSTKSSSIVNDARRETLMDVVKNDEVVKKIVDNPQITTKRTDIGVNQGDDDEQQYRQINDDTEQFMVTENDDYEELNLNDLYNNYEPLSNDKLEDKTDETAGKDLNQNKTVSYGDNLSFYSSPGDVVYDIIYDYQQPDLQDDEYYPPMEDVLTLSTLQYHNQINSNNIEDLGDEVVDSSDYTAIEPLDYPEYQDILENNNEEYEYDIEPEETDDDIQAEQRGPTRSNYEDSVHSQSLKSSTFHSDPEELFKIPVIVDFDAFGSETFSNARLRIPEQFSKLIHQPWTNNHDW